MCGPWCWTGEGKSSRPARLKNGRLSAKPAPIRSTTGWCAKLQRRAGCREAGDLRINGARSAGCVLALCCDILVASEQGYLAMTEVDVGLAAASAMCGGSSASPMRGF